MTIAGVEVYLTAAELQEAVSEWIDVHSTDPRLPNPCHIFGDPVRCEGDYGGPDTYRCQVYKKSSLGT